MMSFGDKVLPNIPKKGGTKGVNFILDTNGRLYSVVDGSVTNALNKKQLNAAAKEKIEELTSKATASKSIDLDQLRKWANDELVPEVTMRQKTATSIMSRKKDINQQYRKNKRAKQQQEEASMPLGKKCDKHLTAAASRMARAQKMEGGNVMSANVREGTLKSGQKLYDQAIDEFKQLKSKADIGDEDAKKELQQLFESQVRNIENGTIKPFEQLITKQQYLQLHPELAEQLQSKKRPRQDSNDKLSSDAKLTDGKDNQPSSNDKLSGDASNEPEAKKQNTNETAPDTTENK